MMHIIIDISNDDYRRIKEIPDAFDSLTSRVYKAIKGGTKLSKRHGRILDIDEAKIDLISFGFMDDLIDKYTILEKQV